MTTRRSGNRFHEIQEKKVEKFHKEQQRYNDSNMWNFAFQLRNALESMRNPTPRSNVAC